MKQLPLSFLLLGACALLMGPAHAEKADRDKPMNIESDALRYDDLKQTSVFTGNVVATKGTIIIRGARVDVRQDADGYQFGVVTAEPGKRAFYRQKRDNLDEYIEGEGEVIEYDGRADTVKFIRRAEMRRFVGTQLGDEVTGNVITYNNGSDTFTVNGQPTSLGGTGTPAPGGRVRAMLSPRNTTAAGPAAAASAPARTPPGAPAGTPLRSSPALGGERN